MLDYQVTARAEAEGRARERDQLARQQGYRSFTALLLDWHRGRGASMQELRDATGLSLLSLREGISRSLVDAPFTAPQERRPWTRHSEPARRTIGRRRPSRPATPAEAPSIRYLAVGEVAAGLGISLATVRRAIVSGRLRGWRTPGGHARVHPADAVAFALRHGIAAEDLPASWR